MYVVVRKGTKELVWPNAYGSFKSAYSDLERRGFLGIAEVYQLIEVRDCF